MIIEKMKMDKGNPLAHTAFCQEALAGSQSASLSRMESSVFIEDEKTSEVSGARNFRNRYMIPEASVGECGRGSLCRATMYPAVIFTIGNFPGNSGRYLMSAQLEERRYIIHTEPSGDSPEA